MDEQKETIFINQPVDREAYKIIKVIATLKEKKIQDIINEALIFYAESKKKEFM